MAEYIERKALREAFDNADADIVEEYEDGDCDWGFGRQNILEVINSVPSADVAPVRHGRWIMRGGKRYCSECGNRACVTRDSDDFWYTVGTDFCPSCGAMMDLEV